MSVSVTVEGLPALLAQVPGLDAKIREIAVNGLMRAGIKIADDARVAAPYLTGTLRRSIKVLRSEDGVYVGSDVPYAARLEFGYVGPDKLGRTYNQSARPYLRPAIDQNHGALLLEVARSLQALD